MKRKKEKNYSKKKHRHDVKSPTNTISKDEKHLTTIISQYFHQNKTLVFFFFLCVIILSSLYYLTLFPLAQPILPIKPLIKKVYTHDDQAFTQGLEYYDGYLWESTGLHGKSQIRQIDITSGQVIRSISLEKEYFGEGLTIFNNLLYQCTWQEGVIFVWDLITLSQIGLHHISNPRELWGITHDSTHLIVSDGSNILYFLDHKNFNIIKKLHVFKVSHKRQSFPQPKNKKSKSQDDTSLIPQNRLNELEYIFNTNTSEGLIYANIFHSDMIAVISPKTGIVLRYLDLSFLKPKTLTNREAVLNGIAYDTTQDRFFITGKLWPNLFEINFDLSLT